MDKLGLFWQNCLREVSRTLKEALCKRFLFVYIVINLYFSRESETSICFLLALCPARFIYLFIYKLYHLTAVILS